MAKNIEMIEESFGRLIKRKWKWLYQHQSNFRAQKVTRDKDGYYIMIKSPVHQEDITILNVCVPNSTASSYTRQKSVRSEREKFLIFVKIFNTLFLIINRTNRKPTKI